MTSRILQTLGASLRGPACGILEERLLVAACTGNSNTLGTSAVTTTNSSPATISQLHHLRHKHTASQAEHKQHAPAHSSHNPAVGSTGAAATAAGQPSHKHPASGPAALYWAGRASGVYRPDPRQEVCVALLQEVHDALVAVGPRGARGSRPRGRPSSGLTMVDALEGGGSGTRGLGGLGGSFWSGLTSLVGGGGGRGDDDVLPASSGASWEDPRHGHPPGHVHGLYLYGGVGCGKTMLMDLFVQAAPPEFQVRRAHYHDFMLDVHAQLHAFRGDADPLLRVADAIAKAARVLCLDEFFVTNVADAVILARLFGRLWDRGLVLVATSNRHPDDLYKGGLQRPLFMPFIHRLKAECVAHDMASTTDYRRLAHYQKGSYFVGPQSDADLWEEFVECGGAGAGHPGPVTIPVQMGRHMDVPQATGKAALFPFADLCGKPVAAADYLAITQVFHTLAVSGLPVFCLANKTEAYRFVTLIDVMYEHRVRMLFSAEAPPFDLFDKIVTQADVAAKPELRQAPDVVVDDNLGFAKDRTMSRLTEMASLEYLIAHAQAHAPENLLALQEAQARKAAAPRE